MDLPKPGDLISLRQAARILGISPGKMGLMVKNGQISAVQYGAKMYRVSKEDLREFLKSSVYISDKREEKS